MKCLVSDKPLGFLVKYLSFFVEIYYVDISNGDTIVLHKTTQKHIVFTLQISEFDNRYRDESDRKNWPRGYRNCKILLLKI